MTGSLSLKWRLSLLLTALSSTVFVVAGTVYFLSSERDVGRESQAARALVQALLRAAPSRDGIPMIAEAAADGFRHARHIDVVPEGRSRTTRGDYPAWLARAFLDGPSIEGFTILIDHAGQSPQRARIVVVPDDELSEVWDDAMNFLAFAIILLVLLNTGAWIIVDRQLKPLEALRTALAGIGHGAPPSELPLSHVSEIASVQRGFNQMAARLHEADLNNRRLTRELIRVQEDERRSIARELHDEFAQHLTAIDFEAVALDRLLRGQAEVRDGLGSIRASVTAVMKILRGRLLQLRPEALDAFGISAAIEDLVGQIRAKHPQLRLESSVAPDLRLDDDRAIAVYRIVQEALTNVIKHAQASEVRISISATPEQIALTVIDDGIGARPAPRRGFGVPGMRERAEAFGGRFALIRNERGGTTIQVSMPLLPDVST